MPRRQRSRREHQRRGGSPRTSSGRSCGGSTAVSAAAPDRGPRAERDAQDALQQRREPQVAPERAVDVAAVAARRGRVVGVTPAIARAASAPVSSACAMPSPVIGSTTPAASPTNSARAVRRAARRSYVGGDRPGPHACPRAARPGPSTRRSCGRSASVAPLRGERLARRRVGVPVAEHAEADVGAAVAHAGTPTRSRGGSPRSNSTQRRRSSTPVKYWRNACQLVRRVGPRSARSRSRRRAAARRGSSGRRPRRASARCTMRAVGERRRGSRHRRRSSAATAACSRTSTPARAGVVDERGVELDARHDARVLAVGGKGQRRPRGRSGDTSTVSVTGAYDGRLADVEPEGVEQAQRAGGEAVAAGLVAGEAGLVDHQDVEAEPAGLDRRPRPRPGLPATTTDVECVSDASRPTVPTFRPGVPIAARIRSSGGVTGSSARPDAERPHEHRRLREADPGPGGARASSRRTTRSSARAS